MRLGDRLKAMDVAVVEEAAPDGQAPPKRNGSDPLAEYKEQAREALFEQLDEQGFLAPGQGNVLTQACSALVLDAAGRHDEAVGRAEALARKVLAQPRSQGTGAVALVAPHPLVKPLFSSSISLRR